jgi:hypothetical protein
LWAKTGNIKILTNATLGGHMLLTFFCKHGRHRDCPGEWPMDDRGRYDHDCSFDIKITKCICNCHSTNQ